MKEKVNIANALNVPASIEMMLLNPEIMHIEVIATPNNSDIVATPHLLL